MRQMGLGRITQLKLIEMAQCQVEKPKFGGEFTLVYLRAGKMQLVALGDLIPINQNSALSDARAASAPWIIERPEIRDGGTPAIISVRMFRR